MDFQADAEFRKYVLKFREEISSFVVRTCDVCNEPFPDIKLQSGTTICFRCYRDKEHTCKHSIDNDMHPGVDTHIG